MENMQTNGKFQEKDRSSKMEPSRGRKVVVTEIKLFGYLSCSPHSTIRRLVRAGKIINLKAGQ